MKNALFLALIVIFFGCKKEDTSNQVPGPNAAEPISYSYIFSFINDRQSAQGDTLRIRVNDVLLNVNASTTAYQHQATAQVPKLKTGDVVSIYYNPGYVSLNGQTFVDENNLKVYLDDELWIESKCRCILNVTKTIGK